MDETLCYLRKGMHLVGGHSFSNDEMDNANGGREYRLEVSELGRMSSVSEGEGTDETSDSLCSKALRKAE